MQVSENTKRKNFSKQQRLLILEQLRGGELTLAALARNHGVHPITIHRWKREMSKLDEGKTAGQVELILEIQKLKEEKKNLVKALGNYAVENEILKTANDYLKKVQRDRKLKQQRM